MARDLGKQLQELQGNILADPEYGETMAELEELQALLPSHEKKKIEVCVSPFGTEVTHADLSRYFPGNPSGVVVT